MCCAARGQQPPLGRHHRSSGGLINFARPCNFGTGTDHAERRRPAMGRRHHHRHLRAAWLRSARPAAPSTPTATTSPSASAISGAGGLTKPGAGTLTLTRQQPLLGRHDGQGGLINFTLGQQLRQRADHAERRRPAVGDRQHAPTSPRGWRRSAPAAAPSTPTATTSPSRRGLTGTGGLTKQGTGHAEPHRHQHLHRRHDGDWPARWR